MTVKGFKSIRSMDHFDLGNLNVMIGANGSGKSNLISLFEFLNEIADQRLQTYVSKSGGANKLLYFGEKNTQYIEIKVDFGPNSYWLKLAPTVEDTLFFEEEGCSYHGPMHERPWTTSTLSADKKESGLALQDGNVAPSVLASIKSWRVYHFHDTSDSSLMKKTCSIDDNDYLKPDASNLAAYLYFLEQKHPQEFRNITDTVRLIAPFFNSFVLKRSSLRQDLIQMGWQHKHSDDYFNANSLSDGTLRFICLATLLLQPVYKLPKTILLDEPELGLHPAAIDLLANLLKSAAVSTQVIVSTQSVTLVNQLEPTSVIVVDREDDQSFFRRLTEEELESWVEDYGLGDMWEKNIIGGRP